MIIENGTLEFKIKQPQGLDPETGFPIQAQEVWSKPIPCQFYPNKNNLLAIVGSESAHLVSYTILIEQAAGSESMRLRGLDGKLIGDFSAQSIETLSAVGQVKIIV